MRSWGVESRNEKPGGEVWEQGNTLRSCKSGIPNTNPVAGITCSSCDAMTDLSLWASLRALSLLLFCPCSCPTFSRSSPSSCSWASSCSRNADTRGGVGGEEEGVRVRVGGGRGEVGGEGGGEGERRRRRGRG